MKRDILKATNGSKHHLFGFHDLVAFNKTGEKLLSIECNIINRPPLAGEHFGVGYCLWQEQQFVRIGETVAMNYPQGSRQQWISNNEFIVNNKVGDHWGADIYDVSLNKKVSIIDSPAHCVTKDAKYAFGINYSRLFRLGGYGYIGIDDETKSDALPTNDGIFVTDIFHNQTRLFISIADVAKIDSAANAYNGFHHYLTHLSLSPDNKRIAFLHRYFLADGGIRTRLMTIGVNGESCRCIASGFLSHFDWKDNNNIIIWGQAGGRINDIRSNPLLSNCFVKPVINTVKPIVKAILGNTNVSTKHFLMVKDSDENSIIPFAVGIIDEDGHPMCCPTDRNLMICDTYPNKETKERTLFFYDFNKNKRIDIGTFFMGREAVDYTLEYEYLKGIDTQIKKMVSTELLCFTRSGLHCDLHPRWDANGEMVAFDSIHEGSRQIYVVKR